MLAIGIDIGGTSIKGAAVNEHGETSDMFSLPIIKGEDQESVIERLSSCVRKYLDDNKFDESISGIGIGIPGSIEANRGICRFSNNLGWEHLEIVKIMKRHFDMPIKITNDANAAALGEAAFGAGKKYGTVIMLTLGTGVGGGIIINGKVYEGSDGTGAELGHIIIDMHGIKCTCGRVGCLEQYASATALTRQTKEAMEKHPESLMHKYAEEEGKISAKTAFLAARKDDKSALEVVDNYVSYLGIGICNICNIFRPDCCVLSGGVAKEGDYLVDKLTAYCAKYDFGFPTAKHCVIKEAELGYMSGIIGAASLILKE